VPLLPVTASAVLRARQCAGGCAYDAIGASAWLASAAPIAGDAGQPTLFAMNRRYCAAVLRTRAD
jgi:hypothetical protein